jgi:hypothetical protein
VLVVDVIRVVITPELVVLGATLNAVILDPRVILFVRETVLLPIELDDVAFDISADVVFECPFAGGAAAVASGFHPP